MLPPAATTLVAYCSCDTTMYKQALDVQPVVTRVAESLAKKLARKHIQLAWAVTPENCNLFLSFRDVDRGSQAMRYFLPLAGAASVSVEGVLWSPQTGPQQFAHNGCAYIGLFGGSAASMLKVCADSVAGKLARTVRKWVAKNGLDRLGSQPM